MLSSLTQSLLELRQKIFNANKKLEKEIKALKSKVDHNRRKYKESERQSKYDRIAKLQENLRILTQMYNEQNDEIKSKKYEINSSAGSEKGNRHGIMQSGSRATSGGVFLKNEFEGFHEIRDENKEDERDLNENEKRLLELFKQNDEEIDDMLD